MRFQRRLKRDKLSRGRSLQSIEKQFREFVQPMHKKYIDWVKWVAELAIDGLEKRKLGEEKYFIDYYQNIFLNYLLIFFYHNNSNNLGLI